MNTNPWTSLLTAIVRWVLFALGGLLVQKGILTEDFLTNWLTGATTSLVGLILMVIPIIWKWFSARYKIELLQEALDAPPGSTIEDVKEIVAEKKLLKDLN